MPFIIFPQADNKLAVIIPRGDVQDCIKDVPEGAPYAIVDSLEVDNDYFNGFVYSEGEAVADIAACKSIHRDIAFMKAVENSNEVKQAEIATQKQELRDITKITLPDTLPEIKKVWPTILN